jgi:hypothetical protein
MRFFVWGVQFTLGVYTPNGGPRKITAERRDPDMSKTCLEECRAETRRLRIYTATPYRALSRIFSYHRPAEQIFRQLASQFGSAELFPAAVVA